jgi:hypothetical protein
LTTTQERTKKLMAMISRDGLLSKTARRYKEIAFDGETYRIQSLTEAERAKYEIQLQDKKNGYQFEKSRRLMVCKTLVDESGSRILSDDDADLLKAVDGRVMAMLYSAAIDHCGYDDKEVEDLSKNSEAVAG